MSTLPKPELLSPAGNWDCARAAVANGADAIFFGMPRFNARLRADNFIEEDLPESERGRAGRRGLLVGGLVAVLDRINKMKEFQDYFLKVVVHPMCCGWFKSLLCECRVIWL